MNTPRLAITRQSRLFVLALLTSILLICGCGTSDETTTFGTPAEGPTVIDVPYKVVASQTVSAAGATITAEGATLVVPPGAVATDTRVEITRLDAPFHQNPYARDEADAIPAIPVGPAFDFGPAGVAFKTPVTVTLPYDPAALLNGYDQVAIAYYTGTRWVVLGGTVDAAAHT